MRLYYFGIFKPVEGQDAAVQLCSEDIIDNYYQRYFVAPRVREAMAFLSNTIAQRTPVKQSLAVTEKEYVAHAYHLAEGVCGVAVTDEPYPVPAALGFVKKFLEEFINLHPEWADSNTKLSLPGLKEDLEKWQTPDQVDGIMKIQRELEETKTVLHKTIESVLGRGEKIDELVAKSDGLSAQSKMFYTSAKKQNSCCEIM